MELGNFSVSLAVKDIEASKLFYEKLGFSCSEEISRRNWLIMKNGNHNIGLFQGMFENNILTFNPMFRREYDGRSPPVFGFLLKNAGGSTRRAATATSNP
jgi:hypothetical protein